MAEQIDPRYDPAFQRGYDGEVVTGSRAAAAARRAAPHVTSALQRPAVAPDEPVASRAAVPAEPRPTVATLESETDAASAPVVHVAAPVMRAPWTNPFAILAAVIGLAALGLGVWMLQEAYQLVTSDDALNDQADYWSMQFGMIAGPIFTGLGVAVLAAVLMFCAVYWARRPAPDADETSRP